MTQPPGPNQPNQGHGPNQPYDPQQFQAAQGNQFDPQQYQRHIEQAQQQYQQFHDQQAQSAQQAFGAAGFAPSEHEAPKPKRFNVRKLLSGVGALAVLAGVAYYGWTYFAETGALKEGQCIAMSGSNSDAEHKSVDCGSSEFSFLIDKVHNTLSADCGDSIPYEYSVKVRRSTTERTVCLVPNLKPNTCYAKSDGAETYKVTDCASADFKVTSVAENATATCSAPAEPHVMKTAGRTYCLEPIQ